MEPQRLQHQCCNRRPPPSGNTTQVRLVNVNLFGLDDDEDGQPWQNLIETLCSTYGVDSSKWTIAIHDLDDCGSKYGPMEFSAGAINLNDVYMVHFEQRKAKSRSKTNQRASSAGKAGNPPTASGSGGVSSATGKAGSKRPSKSKSRDSGRRSSQQQGNNDEDEDEEQGEDESRAQTSAKQSTRCFERTIRIGTCPGLQLLSHSSEADSSNMDIMVVAEIGRRKTVEYFYVNSWLINGISIGHLEHGEKVNDIDDMLHKLEQDAPFDSCESEVTLKAKLLELVDSGYHPITLDEYESGQNYHDKRPIECPIAPRLSGASIPRPMRAVSGERDIHAVVFFFNDCIGQNDLQQDGLSNLGLPLNLQVTLAHDDDEFDVRRWLWRPQGGDAFTGVRGKFVNKVKGGGLNYWLQMQIHVLPQRQDKLTSMYCWSSEPNIQAHQLLDAQVSEQYGRRLYIEVRIIQHPKHKEKDKVWLENLEKEKEKKRKKKGGNGKGQKGKKLGPGNGNVAKQGKRGSVRGSVRG